MNRLHMPPPTYASLSKIFYYKFAFLAECTGLCPVLWSLSPTWQPEKNKAKITLDGMFLLTMYSNCMAQCHSDVCPHILIVPVLCLMTEYLPN